MVLYIENGVLRGVLNRDNDGDFMSNEEWTRIGVLSIERGYLSCLDTLAERNITHASIITVSDEGVPKLTFSIHDGRLSLSCTFPQDRGLLEEVALSLNPEPDRYGDDGQSDDGDDRFVRGEDVMEDD